MENIIKSCKAFIIFSILLGLLYPATVTVIAQLMFPYRANGSLIKINGIIAGSELIGQNITGLKYFHSRPSAVNYDASNSGASNSGPSNKSFTEHISGRIKKTRQINMSVDEYLPADMVLASGSGLDRHISVENALIQAKRVSRTRSIPLEDIKKFIDKNTDHDFIGLWGQKGINVLKLNMDLDNYAGNR